MDNDNFRNRFANRVLCVRQDSGRFGADLFQAKGREIEGE